MASPAVTVEGTRVAAVGDRYDPPPPPDREAAILSLRAAVERHYAGVLASPSSRPGERLEAADFAARQLGTKTCPACGKAFEVVGCSDRATCSAVCGISVGNRRRRGRGKGASKR